jgi:pyruvate carboxylase subunit B
VTVETDRERALRLVAPVQIAGKARNEIVAPMPALVVRIHVAAGDAVHEGQALLALEAMKMENEIKAPRNGIVREIRATPGVAVEKGGVLIVLE